MPTLNDATIKTMREEAVRTGGTVEASDAACKGLRVRASYGGAVGFYLLYRPRNEGDGRGKLRRVLIGKYGTVDANGTVMGVAEARRRALALKGEVADGGDPAQRKRAEAEGKRRLAEDAVREAEAIAGRLTVRQLADRFLHEKRGKRWVHRYRSMLAYNLLDPKLPDLQLGLADKAADDLTGHDVDAVIAAIQNRGSEVQARRVYETLRAMLRFGVKKALIASNPITAISVPENAKPRDRFLAVEELREVWKQLRAWDEAGARDEAIPIPLAAVRVLRLQLLLACRSGEVSGMCKHELSEDGYSWTIPMERSKNGQPHTLPLPARAREIIAAACKSSDHPSLVFPVLARDRSGQKALRSDVIATHVATLQETFGFKDRQGEPATFVSHDLRRTAATYMRKSGTPSEVVSAILNHLSEKKATVTARHYDCDDLAFPMREALTRWDALLDDIADGADPFARNVEDIAELEARLKKRVRGPRLVALGAKS